MLSLVFTVCLILFAFLWSSLGDCPLDGMQGMVGALPANPLLTDLLEQVDQAPLVHQNA